MTFSLDGCEIERVIVVLGYPDTEVPTKFLSSEKVASGKYGVRGNMPGPAGLAPVVLSLEDGLQITIQGTIIQAQKDIPRDQRELSDEPWVSVSNRLERLFKDLSLIGGARCVYAGVIFFINRRDEGAGGVVDAVSNWLKLIGAKKWEEGITQFSLKLGWIEDAIYKCVSIEGYENRLFEFATPPQQGMIALDPSAGKLEETGIRFIVDFNNKAKGVSAKPHEQVAKVMEIITPEIKTAIEHALSGVVCEVGNVN